MKTIQLNFEMPYLTILLDCLHTAYVFYHNDIIEKNPTNTGNVESCEIDTMCGIATLHVEIKETMKIEHPELYKCLLGDEKYTTLDGIFMRMVKQDFYKKAKKRIESLSKYDKTEVRNVN